MQIKRIKYLVLKKILEIILGDVESMTAAPDTHEIHRQVSVLDERMNSHQAKYETGLERMERKLEALEKTILWRMIILFAIGFGISTSVLGFMLD